MTDHIVNNQRAPLFAAATRHPEFLGVRAIFFLYILSPPIVIHIMLQGAMGFLWAVIPALIPLPIGWVIARKVMRTDPYLPEVRAARSTCQLHTPNQEHWGGNSYEEA